MKPTLLRVASLVLGLAAVALFWLAFTQFDDGPPAPGASGSASYEDSMMQAAQVSVLFGVAGCFVLLGAFACHSRARL